MAEFIGNCVIWVVCALALGGAGWATVWLLDRAVSTSFYGLSWVQWTISRRPLTTTIGQCGLRFWKWPAQVRYLRSLQMDQRTRLEQLEAEARVLLGQVDYSDVPYECELLRELRREVMSAAPAGASESEGGAS